MGMPAKVPWIAFLAPGMSVSGGYYPVYLYYKEQDKLGRFYWDTLERPGLKSPILVKVKFKNKIDMTNHKPSIKKKW